jgi:hypothetical protein
MRIIRHMSDEALTEMLLEDDERYLRKRLAHLPEALRAAADKPESFWQRQRASIRTRMVAAKPASASLVGVRVAAAALVLAALFLLQSAPAPVPPRTPIESDQQLLLSVERSVHSDVPEALEPAALLADDVLGGASSNDVPQHSSQGEKQ